MYYITTFICHFGLLKAFVINVTSENVENKATRHVC